MINKVTPVLISISILASCADQISYLPNVEDYVIGEKWVWKWKRTVEDEVLAEGEDFQSVVDFNGIKGFWNGFDTLEIASALNLEPSDAPFRDWPLEVGKKWKFEHSWENDEGTTGKTSQEVEVAEFGEFTVEAGKFQAYQIEYKGTIVNSRGFEGKVNDTWWYSPEVKNYIKHVNDDGYGLYVNELISYSKD